MKTSFKLGLIGYPLGHSLSPIIHKTALAACGLEGSYSLYPTQPGDRQGLKKLLALVRNGEIAGLNVTIPHKQNIFPLLDKLSPTAEATGAVNTIWMHNGNLTGDNTDVPGFLEDLKRFLGQRKEESGNPKLALVLGAGGSAQAVVYALVNDGWEVTIAARRIKQAEDLANRYAQHALHYPNFRPGNFNLLVNTTPVGMTPNTAVSPWPAGQPFPPNAAVYDLVYNPRETKLIRDAHNAGLSATTGLGMLIEQAALSFEIWTGCTPSREILWNTLQTDN
jgi:shikimate dehydrogenase